MLDWAGSLLVGVAQLVELRVVVPAAAGSSPVAHPFRPANADNCRSGVLVGVLRGVQIAVACTRRAAEPNPGGGRPPGPDVVWTPGVTYSRYGPAGARHAASKTAPFLQLLQPSDAPPVGRGVPLRFAATTSRRKPAVPREALCSSRAGVSSRRR